MPWPLIKLMPKETHFKFVRFAIFAAFLSIVAVAGSFVSMFTGGFRDNPIAVYQQAEGDPLARIGAVMGRGFNLGIDFRGGTIYIAFRFEFQFGVGAVFALFHDTILTLGLFSVFRIEFTLTIIAALLTIIGYSMNDTVVVFDRLRENLKKYKKMSLGDVIDLSTNETLSRTMVTSFTALLSAIALWTVGGETLRGFAIAMTFGIVIGTYSSIYVAAPAILLWHSRRGRGPNQDAAPIVQGAS
ncbi:MAG: protein translocase subunit SecF [Proteobacteria bacterium]|nr:protein translocase subunit SecF [Pseudomonadota bacterium]